jgi:hypothetical protein
MWPEALWASWKYKFYELHNESQCLFRQDDWSLTPAQFKSQRPIFNDNSIVQRQVQKNYHPKKFELVASDNHDIFGPESDAGQGLARAQGLRVKCALQALGTL